MRGKKIGLNAIAGLTFQATMVLYNFIFPRLVMQVYGSDVNGLLQSITQFLSYIALLDAGVSAVIRAKLYKPLADGDMELTQRIVNSARDFYKKIAFSFIAYVAVIAIILPLTYTEHFDSLYTLSLVLIIAISTFAEYFFGISYTVLLESDQRKYISYVIQIISVIINTIAIVVLILSGFSIHIVKLATAVLFAIRPIVLAIYCRKRYGFKPGNKELEPIENKWAGLGHHIAYFLHTHTDIVLLTFVKGPLIVSVYSVYSMIINALQTLLAYISGGVEAAFGNMIAKNEEDSLRRGLRIYEMVMFSMTIVFFSTAAVTIFGFVKVYTSGVTDVDYIIPTAGIILIFAEVVHCLRRPYESIVMAAGLLKETMRGAFVETGINLGLSIILVWQFGIAGVAVGTLGAMIFRTTQYAIFVSRNVVKRPLFDIFSRMLLFVGLFFVIYLAGSRFPVECNGYLAWAGWALVIFIVSSVLSLALDFLIFRNELKQLTDYAMRMLKFRK